jgi:putative transposase
VEQFKKRFNEATKMLAEADEDILAFTFFPKSMWRQVWFNNFRNDSTARSGAAPT